MGDLPLTLLTATVWAYWLGVGRMIVRVRRAVPRSGGPATERRIERRFMWMLWVPLVAAWVVLPYLALTRIDGIVALPAFATQNAAYSAVRWVAAVVGLACLAATIRCWRRMGRNWRMDVSAATKTDLITDGPFRRIRHPIYAFSILLMLCSVAIVPTLPMLAVAIVHSVLMNWKARSEERYLAACHGDAYRCYVARTGRFFPRPRP